MNKKIQSGYKLTDFGIIPSHWDCLPLSDVSMINSSNVDKKSNESQEKIVLCNYMDVYYNDYINKNIEFMKASASKDEIRKFQLKKNDVVITKDSETREEIAKAAVVQEEIPMLVCGYHLSMIRPNPEKIDGFFLAKLFYADYLHRYFVTEANGVTRFGLTLNSIEDAPILLPPLKEQKIIASTIRFWDEVIGFMEKQIKAKQKMKKALMQQLLSGKVRFPNFEDEWITINLHQFLKLKLRKVKKPNGPYKRLGIRSHGKGTFISFVKDPDEVGMDYLFQTKKGDLILNITFGWEGAIAMIGDDGDEAYVSHRFPTYEINKKTVLPEFFRYLMVMPRFFYYLGVVSPGGAGRNRVLDKKEFMKIKVKIPTIPEQRKIGDLLNTINDEINTLSNLLNNYKYQKRGLMQKLLTGQIRVVV